MPLSKWLHVKIKSGVQPLQRHIELETLKEKRAMVLEILINLWADSTLLYVSFVST